MQAIPIQAELYTLIANGHFGFEYPYPYKRDPKAYFVATAFTFDRWPVEAGAVALVWEPVAGWHMKPAREIRRTTHPLNWQRGLFVELFVELLHDVGKEAAKPLCEIDDGSEHVYR
ncbi:MAG: hypothetical protein ACTSRN_04760 [Alphaproteobacteria bacterium]